LPIIAKSPITILFVKSTQSYQKRKKKTPNSVLCSACESSATGRAKAKRAASIMPTAPLF
jgi:hypothetical protein